MRLSIKYKFLGIILAITLPALAIFVYFAYSTFSRDKKAFILEMNRTTLHAFVSDEWRELSGRLEEMQVLLPRLYSLPPTAALPTQGLAPQLAKEVLAVTFFQGPGFPVHRHLNTAALVNLGINGAALARLDSTRPWDGSRQFWNQSLRSGGRRGIIPILTFLLRDLTHPQVMAIAQLDAHFLKEVLKQSDMAEMFLIFQDGRLLAHPNPQTTLEFQSKPFPHPVTSLLKTAGLAPRSEEIEIGNSTYFMDVAPSGFKGVYAVSQISKSVAYESLTALLNNGLWLLLGVVGAIFLFGSLFAARITRHIRQLEQAAERIGAGDLAVTLDTTSTDEIGSVAKSFRKMASRLSDLISESAKKAHLEDELGTARLVQSTLLTPPQIDNDSLEIAFHYMPASLCGGDFWDVVSTGHRVTVLMGDATGHGVPAAILTAVAKSCLLTLHALVQGSRLQPEQFMGLLNQVICDSCKGKLLMTMSVAEIDLRTGVLTLCSAGHEAPLHMHRPKAALNVSAEGADTHGKAESSTKFEPLVARGERLGYDPGSLYEVTTHQLEPGDVVLFYTDGMIESCNKEGKEWGERRLMHALKQVPEMNVDLLRDSVVKNLNLYVQADAPRDDVTFLFLKWKERAQTTSSIWIGNTKGSEAA